MQIKKSNTCIAVCRLRNGKILMGGERRITVTESGFETMYSSPEPKITNKNGFLIGGSGHSYLCKIVLNLKLNLLKLAEQDENLFAESEIIHKVLKSIKNKPGYGTFDDKIPAVTKGEECYFLIVLNNKLFELSLYPAIEAKELSPLRLDIEEVPIPYAIGCGRLAALSCLLDEKQRNKHNSREGLSRAIKAAAKISPGCDDVIDILESK